VGGGVADDVDAFGVLVGDDPERGVGVDQVAGIDEVSVQFAGQSGFGEAGADVLGDFGNGDGLSEFPLRTVRQCNDRHDVIPEMKKPENCSGFQNFTWRGWMGQKNAIRRNSRDASGPGR